MVKKISLPGPKATANLIICDDLHDLSNQAADLLESSLKDKPFSLALSGGSTPKALHEELAKRKIDWQNVHFFWGDERCVPPDHSESNYRMAEETLLKHIQVSSSQIHRMHGEADPDGAAQEYESEMQNYFSQKFPSFDLVYLGLGEDCHTASLFPGTPAVNILDRWVVSNYVEKLRATRLTLTFPIFNAAKKVAFLISGESKAEPLKNVLLSKLNPEHCPSQAIRPLNGDLYFIVDRAASKLVAEELKL